MSANLKLLFDSSRGQYIPRDFVQSFVFKFDGNTSGWEGVRREDFNACQDPENEWYWEAWTALFDNAFYIDKDGIQWTLHHDGDLWAVALDWMTDEEKQNFFGEN